MADPTGQSRQSQPQGPYTRVGEPASAATQAASNANAQAAPGFRPGASQLAQALGALGGRLLSSAGSAIQGAGESLRAAATPGLPFESQVSAQGAISQQRIINTQAAHSAGIDIATLTEALKTAVSEGLKEASGGSSIPTTGRSAVPTIKGPSSVQKALEGHVKTPGVGLHGLVSHATNRAGLALNQLGRQRWPNVAKVNGQWYRGPYAGETLSPVPGSTFGPGTPVGGAELASLQKGGQIMDAISGGIGGMGGGIEGVLGGMGEAGMVGAGAATVLGLPLAAFEGLNMVASQRQANAYWQGILGGSNFGTGMSQRVQQAGFRFSTLGNLSGAQANALFQGTTSLAMTGNQRGNAMSTAIQLYDQLGVTIQSSIQAITIAAQSGNKELMNLAQSIQNVTNVAVGANVNANVARQNFLNVYGATTQNIQGTAAPLIASGITAAQTGLGQVMQGADLSGLTSQQSMLLLANKVGMNYGQFVGNIEQGNTGLFGKALTGTLQQYLGNLNVPQEAAAAATQLNQKNPGIVYRLHHGKATQADIQAISAQMQVNGSQLGLQLPQTLSALFPGLNLSSSQAMALAIGTVTGNFAPNTSGPNLRAATSSLSASALQRADKVMGFYQMGATGPPSQQEVTNLAQNAKISEAQARSLISRSSSAYTAIGASPDLWNQITGAFGVGASPAQQAKNWYMQNVAMRGKTDPVMERLLGNSDINNTGTVFQVQTSQGPKLVNINTLQQHYMDQVQSGQAQIVGAQNKNLIGQTVANVIGFQQGSLTGGRTFSGAVAKGMNETQKALQAKVNQETKNLIVVQPTPQLQQWLNFMSPSSNITIDSNTGTNQTAPQYTIPNPLNYSGGG